MFACYLWLSFWAIDPGDLSPLTVGTVAALITSSSCRGVSMPVHAFRTIPLLSTKSKVGVPEIFNLSRGTPAIA